MKTIKGLLKHWEFILLLLFVLEIGIFGIANPAKFFRASSILASVTNYISVCIIALFVTFVMITGGIDIQASALIGLTSICIGVLWSDLGLNIWTAVLLAMLLSTLCGALSGYFIAYCGVQPMVVTLGGSLLYSGLALLISGLSKTPAYQGISGFPAKAANGSFQGFRFLGKGILFGTIPVPVAIYAVLILLCFILLHRTKYGRKVFLIGVNPEAAEYSGINSRLIVMSTYILTSIGASIAGVLLTANIDSAKYDLGSTFTLSIITAVVLGGTLSTGGKGSILGTVLASLMICIMRYGLPLCFGIKTQSLDLPIGIMLLIVVIGRELSKNKLILQLCKRGK